jgi:hypothetical protein
MSTKRALHGQVFCQGLRVNMRGRLAGVLYILDTRGGDGGVCTKMDSRKSDLFGDFFSMGGSVATQAQNSAQVLTLARSKPTVESRESSEPSDMMNSCALYANSGCFFFLGICGSQADKTRTQKSNPVSNNSRETIEVSRSSYFHGGISVFC